MHIKRKWQNLPIRGTQSLESLEKYWKEFRLAHYKL